MSALRLQTFEPASLAARRSDTAGKALAAAREEGFRAGFVAGEAEATGKFIEDEARLSSELIEAIGDARLTNEAARRHVLVSLAPMVEALFTAISPALAEAGLPAEIARLVVRAAEAAPQAKPRLRCAPESALVVRRILSERGIVATIEPAPELLPREAQVFWDQGYDHLDLDACIAQIHDCVKLHLKPHSEGDDNDGRDGG